METLLVVEDDINQALLYKQELEEEGYRVILAYDGYDALEKLSRHDVEIAIIDIRMPRMDGIELLCRILINNRLPVIINTAYAHYKNDFVTRIAEDYIVKSSNLKKLKAKIRECLDRRWELSEKDKK